MCLHGSPRAALRSVRWSCASLGLGATFCPAGPSFPSLQNENTHLVFEDPETDLWRTTVTHAAFCTNWSRKKALRFFSPVSAAESLSEFVPRSCLGKIGFLSYLSSYDRKRWSMTSDPPSDHKTSFQSISKKKSADSLVENNLALFWVTSSEEGRGQRSLQCMLCLWALRRDTENKKVSNT